MMSALEEEVDSGMNIFSCFWGFQSGSYAEVDLNVITAFRCIIVVKYCWYS